VLKGNLAARPFYNERLVSLVLVVLALGVAGLTVFNVTHLNALWTERTRLEGEIQRDEAEIMRVLSDVETPDGPADPAIRARLVHGAGEANELIDRRTFSWTTFFDVMEDVLPLDVRLMTVGHRIEDGDLLLVLTVVARDDPDLNAFIEGMLGTGRFLDVLPTEKITEDDGSVTATVETWYVPLQAGLGLADAAAAPGGGP
jgi:hypothetical protein